MNKRYMDFVPTQSASKSATGARPARRVVAPQKSGSVGRPTMARRASTTVKSTSRAAARPAAKPVAKPAAKPVAKVAFSGENDVALGVIENVGPKFVKTDVPKRPLSTNSHFAKTGVAAAKAKKITGARITPVRATNATAKKSRQAEAKSVNQKNVGTYVPPKTPFINQEKVQKRPLSKNVYKKKADVPVKEEKKGPVTIIAKPEKDSHAGLVVTIILTIILGAAAGTVAFLLLPK